MSSKDDNIPCTECRKPYRFHRSHDGACPRGNWVKGVGFVEFGTTVYAKPPLRKYRDKTGFYQLLRERIQGEQNHRCAYCGEPTDLHGHPRIRPTMDHVRTRMKGGKAKYHNFVLSCLGCNQGRGQMDAYEFAAAPFQPRRFANIPPGTSAVLPRKKRKLVDNQIENP